uniref:Virginiamycin B lyase n=1 Tax=mine drainage metagenome TaxID=410659 RepID=E6QI14_9ZZZZ
MSALVPSAVFPVEGHPDWMAVTSDGVWVTSSSADHVVFLNANTNKPDRVVTVHRPCSGLAVGFGSLWIPSCGDHTLVRVNGRGGAPQATINAGPADPEGGIATGAGSVWLVTSAASELDRIDPHTNQISARIALPAGSFNPVFASGSVWVASNAGNALVRVDPKTNRVAGSTSIGPMPRFLTVGAGSVWVLNQGDGTISRVDAKTAKLLATIPAGIPGFGGEIAFGAGSVWATVSGFLITRIDPTTNRVIQQFVGKGGDSIRCAHDSLWLTFLSDAKVWRLPIPSR